MPRIPNKAPPSTPPQSSSPVPKTPSLRMDGYRLHASSITAARDILGARGHKLSDSEIVQAAVPLASETRYLSRDDLIATAQKLSKAFSDLAQNMAQLGIDGRDGTDSYFHRRSDQEPFPLGRIKNEYVENYLKCFKAGLERDLLVNSGLLGFLEQIGQQGDKSHGPWSIENTKVEDGLNTFTLSFDGNKVPTPRAPIEIDGLSIPRAPKKFSLAFRKTEDSWNISSGTAMVALTRVEPENQEKRWVLLQGSALILMQLGTFADQNGGPQRQKTSVRQNFNHEVARVSAEYFSRSQAANIYEKIAELAQSTEEIVLGDYDYVITADSDSLNIKYQPAGIAYTLERQSLRDGTIRGYERDDEAQSTPDFDFEFSQRGTVQRASYPGLLTQMRFDVETIPVLFEEEMGRRFAG